MQQDFTYYSYSVKLEVKGSKVNINDRNGSLLVYWKTFLLPSEFSLNTGHINFVQPTLNMTH